MPAYREVRLLSVAEAAYLAGLIDGEGTVTLSRKHAGDMRQLVVSISNTELPILEFALLSIGAGKLTNKGTSKAHHSPQLCVRTVEPTGACATRAGGAVHEVVQA